MSEQAMQQVPVGDMEMHPFQDRKTEVASATFFSEFDAKLRPVLYRRFQEEPGKSKKIFVAGEAGVGKGTFDTQELVLLLLDPQLQSILKERNLSPHTYSTALMIKEGLMQGLPQTNGRLDRESINEVSRRTDQMLQVAESGYPVWEGDSAHLFLYEFVAVTTALDMGNTTLRRLAEDEDAVVVFVSSEKKVQRRSFRQRLGLQTEKDNKDKGRVLQRTKTKIDISAEDLPRTQGDHIAIARVSALVNQSMLEVYKEGALEQYLKIPYDLLLKYPLHEYKESELQNFFDRLTRFTDTTMRTHELRPYLLSAYFYYLAEKLYQIPPERYIIADPRFLEKEEINPHPGIFEKYALDPARVLTRSSESPSAIEVYSRG